MVDQVNLVLGVICHHGHFSDFQPDGRFIQRVSVEKGMPITYFISGTQLDEMANSREGLHNSLWFDVIGAMQSGHFINPRAGYSDAYKSEIAIMPYHHTPLVQPWAQDNLGEYFEILKRQMSWSKHVVEKKYNTSPVTAFPPDGIYSFSAAHSLKCCGLDNVVMSGEVFGGNKHAKGLVYWASGIQHLVRTNDIQLNASEFENAYHFVDKVLTEGHENNMPFITVVCDIDEFTGKRGLSLEDGIARVCCVGDAARQKGLNIVNTNAAAHWNQYKVNQENTGQFVDWNHVHAMIHGDGGLGFIDTYRNDSLNYVLEMLKQRRWHGWDVGEAELSFCKAADATCRNSWSAGALTGHYDHNIGRAKYLLQA
ncbi:MAG: hypothetical protein ABIH37_00015 [archaeon]